MKSKWLLVLVLGGIILRVAGLNNFIFNDEVVWATHAQNHSSFGFSYQSGPYAWNHMPLAPFFFRLATLVFGVSTWSIRLAPLLFGLLSIFLTYKLAEKIYDKRAAVFSALLLLFSFWHILASLQSDMDGSILPAFFLLSAYALLRLEETGSMKWKLLTAVLMGLTLLVKVPGLLLFPIFGIYYFYKKKDIA